MSDHLRPYTALPLLFIALAGCLDPKAGGTGTDQPTLTGLWVVDSMMVDGKQDPDFPGGGHELELNSDSSFRSLDATYDMEEDGTWSYSSAPPGIILMDEVVREPVLLRIVKLDLEHLVTASFESDGEGALVVYYHRKH